MVNINPWSRRRGGEIGEPGSLMDLRSEMDRLFNHFFENAGFGLQPTTGMMSVWAPAMELYEESDALVVRAEIPGMQPDDIEISVNGHELTISGERKIETEHKREGVYRSERRYGRFHRAIDLPATIDPDKVEASYEHGVLTLRIPQSKDTQVKRIQVHGGTGGAKMAGTQRHEGQQPGRHHGIAAAGHRAESTGAGSRGMSSAKQDHSKTERGT